MRDQAGGDLTIRNGAVFAALAQPPPCVQQPGTSKEKMTGLAYLSDLHKNANMRTSLDIPDPLFRHLKARAALEGSTLRDLVLTLVQRGLNSNAVATVADSGTELPSIRLGAPMALPEDALNNANLSALADE